MLALARPEAPWPASTTWSDAEQWFHSRPDCTSLLVSHPDRDQQVGLLSRGPFLTALAGRYGFGRALHGNASIQGITQWSPTTLPADATLQQAGAALVGRPEEVRYDDVVIRMPTGRWGVLPAAAILEALSATLASYAMTDSLTGLGNRDRLLAELRKRHAIPCQGTHLAVVFIDLDRFKQVNDVYGHNAGDVVLKEVADRLRQTTRPGDVLGRLGGDEFIVVLSILPPRPQDAAEIAQSLAQRFLATIIEPLSLGGTVLHVGASIGVAVSNASGSDPDTLLREADLAMYAAKRAGGDQIVVTQSVGTELKTSLLSGLAIDDTLWRALRNDEFVLHYQPIRGLSDNRLASVEALIRWQDPRFGLRSPSDFLPAAEASGLIIDIDRWVLSQACRQVREWDADPTVTAPLSLNVNLSKPHLSHPHLLEHVLQALEDTGLEPHRLRLEVPESATLDDLHAAEAALLGLRRAGVKLTLDDLGSGSSTLRHLSALPFDGIKIDRSFIQNLMLSRSDHTVVKLLIDLARSINVKVTAEGIETQEQLQELIDLGCTGGQGFFLGRPSPVTEVLPDWLRAPAPQHPDDPERFT